MTTATTAHLTNEERAILIGTLCDDDGNSRYEGGAGPSTPVGRRPTSTSESGPQHFPAASWIYLDDGNLLPQDRLNSRALPDFVLFKQQRCEVISSFLIDAVYTNDCAHHVVSPDVGVDPSLSFRQVRMVTDERVHCIVEPFPWPPPLRNISPTHDPAAVVSESLAIPCVRRMHYFHIRGTLTNR